MQKTPNDTNEHMEKTQIANRRKKQIKQSHEPEEMRNKIQN